MISRMQKARVRMNSQATVAPLQPQTRRSQQIQESDRARRNHHLTPAAVDKRPRWIWRVVDWKYDVDGSWLKRAYFRFVFLPFNEFSYWLFDLLPPNGRDITGRLCWTEDQGYYETDWEGEQEAAKYRFGHAIRVPLNASLPSTTVNTEQVHPNSSPEVRRMYEKKTVPDEIGVPRLDMIQLAALVERNKPLLESNKLPVT